MQRLSRIASMLLVIVSSGFTAQLLRAQYVSLSPEYMRVAEAKYREFGDVRLRLRSIDLHSLPKDSNGVKGYNIIIPDTTGVDQPLGRFASKEELELHSANCRAESIVVGRALTAESILSSKKDLIFTVYQFQVVDTLKASPGTTVGSQISGIRIGGEVTDAGETLQIGVKDQEPIAIGKTYLLELDVDAAHATSYFFLPDVETILVEHGRIYPSDGNWGPFV